jgi:ThiF family protein
MQTYFMVGAGGTGSHLLPALLTYLRNYHANQENDGYQVVIADGDIFEEKNLNRQLFTDGLVTINKAQAMLLMYPGHPMIAVDRYIGKADIEQMIQDGDCVLICADNFSVRHLIVDHAKTLDNVTVINAGNEELSGSVQLWVRENGENVTPPITYGHPEIVFRAEDDRSGMDCITAQQLPGGEQHILANMTAATFMLAAIARWHNGEFRVQDHNIGWTELQFDLFSKDLGAGVLVQAANMRERKNWAVNPA